MATGKTGNGLAPKQKSGGGMNLNNPIVATITRDRNGWPLVVLDGEPFNGVETSPQKLRSLAQQLAALADVACKTPMKGKKFRPLKVTLEVMPLLALQVAGLGNQFKVE
jgi:hypothetical protein